MDQKKNRQGQERLGVGGQPVLDPKNPASKPQGTTEDQVHNMEGEGQAEQPGQNQDRSRQPSRDRGR